MAMTMSGEVRLSEPPEAVWNALNDPELLRRCIPGCEDLEKVSDSKFIAGVKIKIGPISARFKGHVVLSAIEGGEPHRYRIQGEGEGGMAGFAKGEAIVTLADANADTDAAGDTLLKYDVEAQIGGKIAQLGQRLVNSTAKKLADEFFSRFVEARVQARQPG